MTGLKKFVIFFNHRSLYFLVLYCENLCLFFTTEEHGVDAQRKGVCIALCCSVKKTLLPLWLLNLFYLSVWALQNLIHLKTL